MAVRTISVNGELGEVVVQVADLEVKVQEIEGQLAVVSPMDLKAGSPIVILACHAAARALAKLRPEQLKLF